MLVYRVTSAWLSEKIVTLGIVRWQVNVAKNENALLNVLLFLLWRVDLLARSDSLPAISATTIAIDAAWKMLRV
jgi:hypothetical protein